MKVKMPSKHMSRIEMVPFMDVIFLLLVVFIYTMLSMAVHHGLLVALPKSTVAEIERQLILTVTIEADGSVSVDKEPVALNDLTRVLSLKAADHHDPGVLLFADNHIDYQTLFQVLDQIKTAGLDRISLQAELER